MGIRLRSPIVGRKSAVVNHTVYHEGAISLPWEICIFPTGNEGTLTNFYKADSAFIFAKTGTLSGVVAISGFIYTKKNKLLAFSVLVNNHQASATNVRKAVEAFLQRVRKSF